MNFQKKHQNFSQNKKKISSRKQPNWQFHRRKNEKKKIPICDYQITKKLNYQRRNRVREENYRGIISGKKKRHLRVNFKWNCCGGENKSAIQIKLWKIEFFVKLKILYHKRGFWSFGKIARTNHQISSCFLCLSLSSNVSSLFQ